jgi:hypothetical protein
MARPIEAPSVEHHRPVCSSTPLARNAFGLKATGTQYMAFCLALLRASWRDRKLTFPFGKTLRVFTCHPGPGAARCWQHLTAAD